MQVLSFLVVFLSVEEPSWDSVSFRIADNVSNTVALSFSQLSGSESWIDSQDFADEESESSSDTLDFVEGIRNSSLTIDVGVKNTMNVLEVILCVLDNQ